MKYLFISILFIVVSSFTGCENEKLDVSKPILFKNDFKVYYPDIIIAPEKDDYIIEEVLLDGDILTISFHFGAGKLNFPNELIITDGPTSDDPPQVGLYLYFPSYTDLRLAYLYKTLKFNLKPLKKEFKNGKYQLNLIGWDEPIYYEIP